MVGRIYVLTYKGDPKKKLEQFQKLARSMDMDFSGDLKGGSFEGGPYVAGLRNRFKGTYEVKGDRIEVTILEKPTMVPWEMVESTLRKFFSED